MTRIAVEVGGTFTDLVAVNETGVVVRKVPSVPAAPEEGVMAALQAADLDLAACSELVHGSTIATNAILERKGARVAFVTTEGFRDLLFLQRHDRREIYDIRYRKPSPVVDRTSCFQVTERMLADGTVEIPLDEREVNERLVPALKEGGYDAVALCFLNAYANPVHEERAADLLRARLPYLRVSRSSQISLEFREYERASTTVLSAYVQPVVDTYVRAFEQRVAAMGFRGSLSVMQSSGARLPVAAVGSKAIAALFSGPAAGVIGAVHQAGRSGFKDVITLDVGGTSSDVCVVENSKPPLTRDRQIDGLPLQTPMMDIITTGAGGGSIVWQDDGGMLRVGPDSAGADPGPACYGKGGARPTITDAHVVCGTIRPEVRLGGVLPLHRGRAMKSLEPLAERFSMSCGELADSAIRVATHNIVQAIRFVSTERGKDPRNYALVAFGGSGPLHAVRVADALGIPTVVVPPSAGVVSAFGLLAADFALHEHVTHQMPLRADSLPRLEILIMEARKRIEDAFDKMGISGPLHETISVEMRLSGQAFEIPVALAPRNLRDVNVIEERFRAVYREAYNWTPRKCTAIDIVGISLSMAAKTAGLPDPPKNEHKTSLPFLADILENRHWIRVRVRARDDFTSEEALAGPCLVEDRTSTLLVPRGWSALNDAQGNLLLRRGD